MEGLEGGINSSKGPPWKWDKVVVVMEEAKRIGEKPGAPYPVTQEELDTGDVLRILEECALQNWEDLGPQEVANL